MTDNARKAKRQAPSNAPVVELIVRRGALRRFDKLKNATTDLPVKLSWDRRLQERRASGGDVARERRQSNRRQSDRRQKPPFTWNAADFVVVEPRERQSARASRKSKRR